MMLGLLPPSSSVTRFTVAAASRMIHWPTSVDPVNAILSTPGCRTSAAPATAPGPGTTFRAPAGNPASTASSPSIRAVSGVSCAGLDRPLHQADRLRRTVGEAGLRREQHEEL